MSRHSAWPRGVRARWRHDFFSWSALPGMVQGRPGNTDSFLYMLLLVNALLPADRVVACV